MGAILYGGSRMDLFSGALVVGLLACTLAAASWRPARSACRSDPARLLREE
jgi:ABC-type lipoprotein release transport system permease subunit